MMTKPANSPHGSVDQIIRTIATQDAIAAQGVVRSVIPKHRTMDQCLAGLNRPKQIEGASASNHDDPPLEVKLGGLSR